MKLFKLNKNFSYQAIDFVDSKYDILRRKIENEITSIKKEWNEFGIPYIKFLDTKLKAIKDYTDFTLTSPVFAPRAVEILKDFFVDGELLPIKTLKEKDFYLYNIFPEIDCVDQEKSLLVWNMAHAAIMSSSKKILFSENKIDRHIFKTKYLVSSAFVTDTFVKRVLENDLKGFQFIPLWDSETGAIEDIKENRILT